MSLEIHVVAVGPHKQDLTEHYEHTPADYTGVPEGQLICTQIGPWVTARTPATELCEILGCDIELPRTWTIDPSKVDQRALADTLDQNELNDMLRAIRDLSAAGFSFYLRPDF